MCRVFGPTDVTPRAVNVDLPELETVMIPRKQQSDQMCQYNAHFRYPPPLRQSLLLATITITITTVNQDAHTATKMFFLRYSSLRQTNMFLLVERFTFRPSSHKYDLPNPPPTLPTDIQYWAGVIMRNAYRKDDSRGGIQQCANSA